MTIPTLVLPNPKSQDRPSSSPSPAYIAHQWRNVYDVGKMIYPALALTASILDLAAARVCYHSQGMGPEERSKTASLSVAAALLTTFIVPYTILVIMPVNRKLDAYRVPRAVEGKKGEMTGLPDDEDALSALLASWSRKNFVRGLFPLMGAVLGMAMLLNLL